jgi:hypothetical protein
MGKNSSRTLLTPENLPLAKKITAVIIGKALSALSARHTESRDAAFAKGTQAG